MKNYSSKSLPKISLEDAHDVKLAEAKNVSAKRTSGTDLRGEQANRPIATKSAQDAGFNAAPRRSRKITAITVRVAADVNNNELHGKASPKTNRKPSLKRVAEVVNEVAGSISALPAPEPKRISILTTLGVENGIFIVFATKASHEKISKIFRAADYSKLRVSENKADSWLASEQLSAATIYTAFIPFPFEPKGRIKLGVLTENTQTLTFEIDCIPWRECEPADLDDKFRKYGRALARAFAPALSEGHPLSEIFNQVTSASAKVNLQRPDRISGYLDGVVDGIAHGWAYDAEHPERKINVEIICGAEVVGEGAADLFRSDLAKSNIGDGSHHFQIVISRQFRDGQEYKFEARANSSLQMLKGAVHNIMPLKNPMLLDEIPKRDGMAVVNVMAGRLNINNSKALEILAVTLNNAYLQQETGKQKDARSAYKKLIKALGPTSLFLCKIAETWLLDDDINNAEISYRAAIELEQDYAWAYIGLGNVLQRQNKLVDALSAFRIAKKLGPDIEIPFEKCKIINEQLTSLSATAFLESGNVRDATTVAIKALISDPLNQNLLKLAQRVVMHSHVPLGQYDGADNQLIKSSVAAMLVFDAVLEKIAEAYAANNA